MKKFYLLKLFVILIIINASAQTDFTSPEFTIYDHKRPIHPFQEDEFDLFQEDDLHPLKDDDYLKGSFTLKGKSNLKSTKGELLLDSTIRYTFISEADSVLSEKREYEYDASGNRTLRATYNWDSENEVWVERSKNEGEYDANCNNTLWAFYNWDSENEMWVGSSKSEYEYDASGNMTLLASYNWDIDNEVWVGGSKDEYEYDEEQNIILRTRQNWDEENDIWVFTWKYEYEYDALGNITLGVSYTWDSNNEVWVLSVKYEWEYNASGHRTLEAYFNWNSENGVWVGSWKHEWEYDANGNMTLDASYNWDSENEVWVVSWKAEYEYDASGNRILEALYNWNIDNEVWINSSKNEYEYDASGNMTLDAYYNWDSDNEVWINNRKLECEYDASGNMTLWAYYNWDIDNEVWIGDWKNEWEYDANGNMSLQTNYNWVIENDVWVVSRKHEYEYDANGNMSLQTNYNWVIENDVWVISSKRFYYYSSTEFDYSIFIDNQTTSYDDQVEIYVKTSEITTEDNIIAYQFDIEYDNSVFEYTGNDITGTIAEGGTVEVNTSVDGKLSISYMNSEAIVGEGDILILQFNPLAVGTTQVSISNAFLNNIPIDNLTHGTIIVEDVTPPTAAITYSHDNIRYAHELLITSTFSEPMNTDNAVLISFSGAASLAEAEMTRVSETVYTYTYTIPKADGEVTVSLSNGTDLWGNEVVSEPTSGSAFTIIGIRYGDVDGNNHIQAYDAALTLQYSVGLDPLPNLDPLPWETWRIESANVDGVGGVTANDASLILKYTIGLIDIFPVEDNTKSVKSTTADVSITYENDEFIFTSTGELFGLNIFVENDFDLLGQPMVYVPNMMQSWNITDTNYAFGLATAYAPEEGKTFLKIPFTSDEPASITFDMIVNSEHKAVTVDIVISGIEDIRNENFIIYPNPVRDELNITDIKVNSTISIYDLGGKLMHSTTATSTNPKINVSGLQDGIYVIIINEGNSQRVSKFIKQ